MNLEITEKGNNLHSLCYMEFLRLPGKKPTVNVFFCSFFFNNYNEWERVNLLDSNSQAVTITSTDDWKTTNDIEKEKLRSRAVYEKFFVVSFFFVVAFFLVVIIVLCMLLLFLCIVLLLTEAFEQQG